MVWKEWRSRITIFSIATVFIALTLFKLPKETQLLTATSVSAGTTETHLGTKTFWVVKLMMEL